MKGCQLNCPKIVFRISFLISESSQNTKKLIPIYY